MTLKLAQFCDDPKNIHKIFIPQKIFIFLKEPKKLKFRILNKKKKNWLSLRMCENIRVPPPPWDLLSFDVTCIQFHPLYLNCNIQFVTITKSIVYLGTRVLVKIQFSHFSSV